MRWQLLAGLALLAVVVLPLQARDASQVRKFRSVHPCPSTGRVVGPCPGWVVDHVRPLCDGGRDAPSNMRWQSREDSYQKDKIERAICRQPRVGQRNKS